MVPDRAGIVWAATWVPTASPLDGYGATGYAVAWIDLADGTRVQALVEGGLPSAGDAGFVCTQAWGDIAAEVFKRSPQ